MQEVQLLVFSLREGRRKALEAAQLEALSVLNSLSPSAVTSGPLADRGGVFWLQVPCQESDLDEVKFERLGYTTAVDLVVPISDGEFRGKRPDIVKYRGKAVRLERLYELNEEERRQRDPDQRRFYLRRNDGEVQEVIGYRGDGSKYGKRALPVCDAQLLVNLANRGGTLLDPFAGAGGVVQEAVRCGLNVISVDIDPMLEPGLKCLGATHYVASAADLPFPSTSISCIATEPPFDRETESLLPKVLGEMYRVVIEGGRLSMLCADWQAEIFRQQARVLDLKPFIDLPIDRKGYPCHLFGWQR